MGFFDKRTELSAHAAQKAAVVLLIVANYIRERDPGAALTLLAVAGALVPEKKLSIGKVLPNQPQHLTSGLEALITLTESAPPR
jgi:hypothetical protein